MTEWLCFLEVPQRLSNIASKERRKKNKRDSDTRALLPDLLANLILQRLFMSRNSDADASLLTCCLKSYGVRLSRSKLYSQRVNVSLFTCDKHNIQELVYSTLSLTYLG